MATLLENKSDLEKKIDIPIDLPLPFGLSHKRNILYCIEKLAEYSKKTEDTLVIGYRILTTGWGSREQLFRILPQGDAEKIKEGSRKKGRVFEYITYNELIAYQRDIDKGKYKLEKGRIIGPSLDT